jgi:penicillin amidase
LVFVADMPNQLGKRLRTLFSVVTILILLAAVGCVWFYTRMRASLPLLDGSARVPGLTASVTVERDAQGVPTLHAANRLDVARGLGFLHGQDRFFQMDLARRRAAGELSALIGKATIESDRKARMHDFRSLAQRVLARLPATQRALLDAYAQGVNAGLTQLHASPFEYIVLRAHPEPWKPEDSVLMIYAMTLDLQDSRGNYEQSLACVRDVLGNAAVAYFAPLIGPNDAALDGSVAPISPMPTAAMIDVRQQASAATDEAMVERAHDDSVLLGSNAFALAGSRTATGDALVANDMHLTLRLPNIWYRASWQTADPVSGKPLRVTGVTLPGTPFLVAGSNGRIAWGFTNADADSSDIVTLDTSTVDPSMYIRGHDLVQIEKRHHTIAVKGGEHVDIDVPWTSFGPIVGHDAQNRSIAMKWTMDDPEAANFDIYDLENASTVEEAVSVAHRCGVPVQNLVVADRTGKIAWTIAGKLPRRVGFDGRLPVSWTYGDRRWEGFLNPDEIPTVIAPSAGQIWTANNRILDSEALLKLGDGGYERPQRAAEVRDLLTPLQKAVPADLLKIQLDTGAPYLDRWHTLLTQILTDAAIAQKSDRGKLRKALLPWSGHADADSVSYRLVRRFRQYVATSVYTPIFARCVEVYPDFSYRRFHIEEPLWDMLTKQPQHLLNPYFKSWNDLLLAAADSVIRETDREGLSLDQATWGKRNRARIEHPLAKVSRLAAVWLRAPEDALSGDYDTPRVQAPDDGASERFVVSPGREEEGIFEMPGGESGHPLSPFFQAGHEAWVRGLPTPFLPGATAHTLTLTPGA